MLSVVDAHLINITFDPGVHLIFFVNTTNRHICILVVDNKKMEIFSEKCMYSILFVNLVLYI